MRESASAILFCLGLGTTATLACQDPSSSEPTRPPLAEEPNQHYTLANGLEVVLVTDHELPLIAFNLSYHVGSIHDGAHKGIAHLVEHLMFRGTKAVPDGQFKTDFGHAGAIGLNARTGESHTSFHVLIPANQLPLALWLESDRMADLAGSIEDHEVEEEVRTTIDEWSARVESSRTGLARLAWIDTIFPEGHPYRSTPPELIRRLRPSAVREFAARYYGPANATLVLVGDLPDDVHELIERQLGSRSGGQRPALPELTIEAAPAQPRVSQHSQTAMTFTVILAWPTPGLYQPGDAEADLLASLLDEGRLESLVRAADPGATLRLGAAQQSKIGQSVFTIVAEFEGSESPDSVATILENIAVELRAHPPSADEIQLAQARMRVDILARAQTLEARAAMVQLYVATGKPPDWLEQDLARYRAVDADRLAIFIDQYIVPERRLTTLIYPHASSEVAP